MKILAKTFLILFGIFLFYYFLYLFRNQPAIRPGLEIAIPMVYQGSSDGLKSTKIVATLDAPVTTGTNLIWCASFPCAWKSLQQDLAREPICLEGNPESARMLNEASDVRPAIPAEGLYTASGRTQDGIVMRIQNDMRLKFPDKEAPKFLGVISDSVIAYSYLEANVKFSLPYNQCQNPLVFTNGNGTVAAVNSFGLPPDDENTYFNLRKQARVLFYKGEGRDNLEFAIDLCSNSSPSQIVVARVSAGTNLSDTLNGLERKTDEWNQSLAEDPASLVNHKHSFGPTDVLLVPDLYWFISHRFSELETRSFFNRKLKGQSFGLAREDILFRLDKNGAELNSEAMENASAGPHHFIINQPFLIYMKKRGAQTPYFVMWVDNAELLSPFGSKETNAVALPKAK